MTSREARSSHSRSRAVRKQVLAAFAGLITLPLSAFSMDLNQQVNFNIPAQDLAGALIQFSKQAGVQVIISEDLTGQTTPGISGARTIRQALGELLAPTGLGYRVAGETSITIGKGMTTQLLKEGDDGSASVSAATAAPERSLIRLAQGDLAHGVDAGRSSDPHRRVEPVQEEVVVTGTNIRGAASTAQVITIDREIIDQSGRGSIGRVLETVPQFFGGGQNIGVRGATSRANDLVAASSPNLRGLGSGSTLTLVNGRRLALSSGVGGADISAIPMGAIDRIEILTDGASAIYGSDAVGGVVNVILRKDYDGMETRALVGQSTYGDGTQWQVSQLAGTAWGSGNLLFHYEYDKTDEVLTVRRPYARAVTPYEDFLFPDMRRHSLYLALNQDLAENFTLTIDGIYTHRKTLYTRSDPSFIQHQNIKTEQHSVVTTLEWDLNADWSLRASFISAEEESADRNLFGLFPGPVFDPERTDFFHNRYLIGELQATGTLFQLGERAARLALGAGVNDQKYGQTFDPPISSGETVGGRESEYVYSELFVPLVTGENGRRLDLTLAARYEDFSDFGDAFTPKIGLLFAPSANIAFRASWGKSFRAPELHKVHASVTGLAAPLSPPYEGKPAWVFVGGDGSGLTAERATTWSFAATWTPEQIPGLSVTLSPFLSDYKDRIDYPFPNPAGVPANPEAYAAHLIFHPTDEQLQALIPDRGFNNFANLPLTSENVAYVLIYNPTNITRVRTRGADLVASYPFSAGGTEFKLSTLTTYLRQEQPPIAGEPMARVSGTIFYPASLRSRVGLSWKRNPFFGTLSADYTDSLYNNVSATQNRVDSWLTFDAQFGWRPQSAGIASGLELTFSVQNLLNEDPPFLAYDSTYPAGVGYDSTNASGLGRFFSMQALKRW